MIIVLMAAFNEEKALVHLLPRMPQRVAGHRLRVVILSDGSTDGTAAVARECGIDVLEFEKNRGKGAVLRSGLDAIDAEPYAALVFMDADGQHDPLQLPELVGPVLDGSADIVVGSRYVHDAGRNNTPWNRYAVRCIVRAVLRVLLSSTTTDPFSGYRCLTPRAAECLDLRGDRYESELEMLFSAERNELRVAEVPVPRIYGPNTSKMNARHGALVGRTDVVYRYATTIIREAYRLNRRSDHRANESITT
jgi:glycosyltransferase involved in cell wall biosynthesis